MSVGGEREWYAEEIEPNLVVVLLDLAGGSVFADAEDAVRVLGERRPTRVERALFASC